MLDNNIMSLIIFMILGYNLRLSCHKLLIMIKEFKSMLKHYYTTNK